MYTLNIHCMYILYTLCITRVCYRVATISRLLKIMGLFCKRALKKRQYSASETYNFKEPTNRSHPITESRLFSNFFSPCALQVCVIHYIKWYVSSNTHCKYRASANSIMIVCMFTLCSANMHRYIHLINNQPNHNECVRLIFSSAYALPIFIIICNHSNHTKGIPVIFSRPCALQVCIVRLYQLMMLVPIICLF